MPILRQPGRCQLSSNHRWVSSVDSEGGQVGRLAQSGNCGSRVAPKVDAQPRGRNSLEGK